MGNHVVHPAPASDQPTLDQSNVTNRHTGVRADIASRLAPRFLRAFTKKREEYYETACTDLVDPTPLPEEDGWILPSSVQENAETKKENEPNVEKESGRGTNGVTTEEETTTGDGVGHSSTSKVSPNFEQLIPTDGTFSPAAANLLQDILWQIGCVLVEEAQRQSLRVASPMESLRFPKLDDQDAGDASKMPFAEGSVSTEHVMRATEALLQLPLLDDATRDISYYQLIDKSVPKLVSLAGDDGWQFITSQQNVNIYKRTTDQSHNSLHCFKGETLIDERPELLLDVFFNLRGWVKWEPLAKEATIIQELDRHTRVYHMKYEAQNLLIKHRRDFCILLHAVQRTDGGALLLGQSVKHPSCPPSSDYVRSIVRHSGVVIHPVQQDGETVRSRVIYVTQVDLSGLPNAIINSLQVKRPLLLANLRQWLTERRRAAQAGLSE
jgi:hypothetical protein